MSLVTITAPETASPEQQREWCERLEQGCILFFPRSPIALAESDLQFLRGQQQTDSSLHKNIAYKPKSNELTGVDTKTANPAAVDRLRSIMRGANIREPWITPHRLTAKIRSQVSGAPNRLLPG